MENPWLQVSVKDSVILDVDRAAISQFNQSKRNAVNRINDASIPEPFIGNPDSARLVLLNLNPGDAEGDGERTDIMALGTQ